MNTNLATGETPLSDESDSVRMHAILSAARTADDLSAKDRAFLMRAARKHVADVSRSRVEEFVQDKLGPLLDERRKAEKTDVSSPPYTEEHVLPFGIRDMALRGPGDAGLAPGSVLISLPWSKADPRPEQTAETSPAGVWKSRAALGSVNNGSGELSIGVGAGHFQYDEYPAPENFLFFWGAGVSADSHLIWQFPWPPSDLRLRVDVTVNVTAWQEGTTPIYLAPNGRYGVAAAFSDATLSLGGPTDNPPATYSFVRRFIDVGLRGDGAHTPGELYRQFPLSGSILLKPGATYLAVGVSVTGHALYAAGDGTGFAAVNMIRPYGPALYMVMSHTGPLRVSPPQLIFTWM